MKIRYCPHCVQLVHFEPDSPIQRCWNCHNVTNFDLVKLPEERFALWLLGHLNVVGRGLARLCPRPSIKSPWNQKNTNLGPLPSMLAKAVLVGSIPIVILMLLVSNSFDIHIVHDLTAPFSLP